MLKFLGDSKNSIIFSSLKYITKIYLKRNIQSDLICFKRQTRSLISFSYIMSIWSKPLSFKWHNRVRYLMWRSASYNNPKNNHFLYTRHCSLCVLIPLILTKALWHSDLFEDLSAQCNGRTGISLLSPETAVLTNLQSSNVPFLPVSVSSYCI